MLKYSSAKMKKGFTILEVLVAIFIITVGLIATLVLITKTLGQTSISFSQLTAAYLTQEGIEIVRNIRDTNWVVGDRNWDAGLVPPAVDCSTGCEADYTATTLTPIPLPPDPNCKGRYLNINGGGFYSYDSGGTATKFKRKITIEQIPVDILKVTVRVEWEEKGKTFSHTAQENLYKWR